MQIARMLHSRQWLACWLAAGLLLMPAPGGAAQREVRVLLVPEQEAVLSSRIKARIEKLHLREGERFERGQLLVEMDCDLPQAELQKAQTDFLAARETHEANLRLREFGSVSELELALSSARHRRAEAEVRLHEARVAMCVITAPFAGRVVKRRAQQYENVGPDQPLLEILDDSRLKLHLLIPSSWLLWLKEGQPFAVRIDETGMEYGARVTALGARVNPVNQTLEVEGRLEGHPAGLMAGMSGMASFPAPAGGE